MQRRVETLPARMRVKEAIEAFSRSHHRGFPVLAQGKLVGIVTQSDLGNTPSKTDSDLRLQDIMTPHPVTVTPESSLPQVLDLLNRLKISRLPVTEGNKLVGIITRGDIIRAESERLSGKTTQSGPASTPSCCIYQTRAPATGRGRLLVPLSDPENAPLLLKMALAIARQEHYELECLHVVLVHRNIPPEEAAIDMAKGKQLLSYAEWAVQDSGISLHTQIRVAHDVALTMLEVIKQRHIDLILLGWRRPTMTPGRLLGNVVDTLLRQAPCPVIIVRSGKKDGFKRWLLPSAGGPNSKLAMKLLPALMSLGQDPRVHLCAIAPTNQDKQSSRKQLLRRATALEKHLNRSVITRLAINNNVAEAIVSLSHQYQTNVIVLGTSREGLFSHVIKGNIPLEVLQNSDATIILVQHNAMNRSSAMPEASMESEPLEGSGS